jgi:hypothetical protein
VIVIGGAATVAVSASGTGLLTLTSLATAQALGALPPAASHYAAKPGVSPGFVTAGTSHEFAANPPPDHTVTAAGTSPRLHAAGTSHTFTANPRE